METGYEANMEWGIPPMQPNCRCVIVPKVNSVINVLALVKDLERYIFLYDDKSHDQLLRTMGRYAADVELSFTWYDAAVLSQRIRLMG